MKLKGATASTALSTTAILNTGGWGSTMLRQYFQDGAAVAYHPGLLTASRVGAGSGRNRNWQNTCVWVEQPLGTDLTQQSGSQTQRVTKLWSQTKKATVELGMAGAEWEK